MLASDVNSMGLQTPSTRLCFLLSKKAYTLSKKL